MKKKMHGAEDRIQQSVSKRRSRQNNQVLKYYKGTDFLEK